MNEKQLQIASVFADMMGQRSDGSKIVTIATPSVNIASVNLVILKALLDLMKEQGVFVTIDRPHQYIEHLLKIHKIEYSKLTFIDMISTFSGDTKRGIPGLEAAQGPFSLSDLLDLIKISSVAKDSQFFELLRLDFLLFDNIASLLIYNSYEQIQNFFSELLSLLKESGSIFVTFIIDPDHHSEVYNHFSTQSNTLLEIKKDMSLVQKMGDGHPGGDDDMPRRDIFGTSPTPRRI